MHAHLHYSLHELEVQSRAGKVTTMGHLLNSGNSDIVHSAKRRTWLDLGLAEEFQSSITAFCLAKASVLTSNPRSHFRKTGVTFDSPKSCLSRSE